jgi:isopentenyl-diphosphate Delta-isomerase
MDLFSQRKQQHLDLSMEAKHQVDRGLSLWDSIQLTHEALPECDLNEVNLTTRCTAHLESKTPFVIVGMTAGHSGASAINEVLADACARRGWVFGLGSLRRDLESLPAMDDWASFRDRFPTLQIIANIGITQLPGLSAEKFSVLLSALRPDAIAIHLNALQEALQPEGTPFFKDATKILRAFIEKEPTPVIAKETGAGISKLCAQRLIECGVRGIDVSGLGGTHWGRIEGSRSSEGSVSRGAAETLRNWGIPTPLSVMYAKESAQSFVSIWASGGVRSGLDAARAIALGATRVGFAQPALQAALQSEGALDRWMDQIETELKISLFCTGSSTPEALRSKEDSWIRLSIS